MNKKLLLSVSPIMSLAPIATVSCVNPFTDNDLLKTAQRHNKNNSIFANKTFDEFKQKLIKANIYPNNTDQEKEEFNKVLLTFKNFFDNDVNEINYLTLDKFNVLFKIENAKLSNKLVIFKDKQKNIINANITSQAQILLMEYLFGKSPFGHTVLNKIWTDNTKVEKTLYEPLEHEGLNVFTYNKSVADVNIESTIIIPNAIVDMIKNNEFMATQSVETFTKAYKQTISTLSKFIKKVDQTNEHNLLNSLAPIYYVLENPKKDFWINKNYAPTQEGVYAMFTNEGFAKLDQNIDNRITDFANDPEAFYKKHKNITNKHYADKENIEEFTQTIQKYNEGIGKLGLTELVAYSLYFNFPADIQILDFKDKQNNKIYLIQYTDAEGNSILVNPVADFKKDSTTIYKNKNELAAAGYTLDTSNILGQSIQSSVWK
ncbi:hypothetical protein KQ874_02925 [Mycoplasma sp. ES3157-GEN-MYC]|uniref:Uncharacterized protein n=1 Tax=Mycoplasma miroungigenitalium TaxID=754515 RepID=A0A6M4J9T0_9MOLU|nr:hypothetical protein [Mycoplasma miroungigenitalium]MBU4690631.1 hypothetical protein [Mycoplasma miroungigenitalium]MBU4691898.1 hypothetical protein [Mycoplasma miroungigenitalium]QJR43754.1 hypothetical protein HLA87_03125 [Mycoplasma miroungigenitalium]